MLLQISTIHPEPRKIRTAVETLEREEVIAYPTDSVYALGCDVRSKRAVERLARMRNVPATHPFALMCADISMVTKYARVSDAHYALLRRTTPGAYCFIFEASKELPRALLSKRRTVGIRIPNHPVALDLVRGLGRPIVTTSAEPPEDSMPFVDATAIPEHFREVALVLDAGAGDIVRTTVIDLTQDPPLLVREGAGPIDEWA